MDSNAYWLKLLERYLTVKRVYIECEETDPELKTNLQPLNEFRALLDHIMRLVAMELNVKNLSEPERTSQFQEECRKANSHICRAFYDICDMASINYRNKICGLLEPYSSDAIMSALPEYYSRQRPRIDEISQTIAGLRNGKGREDGEQSEEDRFEEYNAQLDELREIYQDIHSKMTSVEDCQSRIVKREIRDRRWNVISALIIGLIGAAFGVVLTMLLT